ncbi:MAG: hypothetical protein GXP25_06810 [Planctomycetes bacterium]|nr:hypothetical protein [Planctomycetota bacterium]
MTSNKNFLRAGFALWLLVAVSSCEQAPKRGTTAQMNADQGGGSCVPKEEEHTRLTRKDPAYCVLMFFRAIRDGKRDQVERCVYFDEKAFAREWKEAIRRRMEKDPEMKYVSPEFLDRHAEKRLRPLVKHMKNIFVDLVMSKKVAGEFAMRFGQIDDQALETSLVKALTKLKCRTEIKGNVAVITLDDGKKLAFRKSFFGNWQIDMASVLRENAAAREKGKKEPHRDAKTRGIGPALPVWFKKI